MDSDQRQKKHNHVAGSCGILPRPVFLLILVSSFPFLQSFIVNGLTPAVMSTLEKRYGFTSTNSGIIFALYDVGVLLVIIPFSHYGAQWHQAKLLGIGKFIFGLGCLLWALPQFLYGAYSPSKKGYFGFCSSNNTDDCELGDSASSVVGLFIFAQLIIGIGASTLYTVGPSYLDASVGPKRSPLYIGVFYALSIIGPALGYLGAAATLDIYVDPTTKTDLTPEQTKWVGAWWISFLLIGIIAVLTSPFYLCFPSRHRYPDPVSKKMSTKVDSSAAGQASDIELDSIQQVFPDSNIKIENETESTKPNEKKPLRAKSTAIFGYESELLYDILRVMKSKAWLFNALGQTSETFIVSAVASFLPKAVKIQFNLSSSTAAIMTGITLIPGGAGGMLFGSYLIKRFDLSLEKITLLCIITSAISLCVCPTFMIGCDQPEVIGITSFYPKNSSVEQLKIQLDNFWNAGCNCYDKGYDPVCGSDDHTYYSSCFAGCKSGEATNGFHNCTSIVDKKNATIYGSAMSGPCTSSSGDCGNKFSIFLFALFLILFTTFLNHIPCCVVQLRVLGERLSPLGLSMTSILYRVVGAIPGPIIFGSLLDENCLIEDSTCGKQDCQIYDVKEMRITFVLVAVITKIISTIFFFLSWYFVWSDPNKGIISKSFVRPSAANQNIIEVE